MHKTQLHLGIWTRIVLYYLTCKKHNSTSGFGHVSSCIISHAQNTIAPRDLNTYRPVLSHTQETQQHLTIWTRVVLYYLTCTEHNQISGAEHLSSCRLLSHCTELHRFSVMGYKINLTVEIIHIDNVLLIHKAINLALDKARAHSYKMLRI